MVRLVCIMLDRTLVLLLSILVAVGCAGAPEPSAADKPQDAKADAVDRLCRDAGAPDGCDICAVRGWYGDGECDEFCSGDDLDCSLPSGTCSWDIASPIGETSDALHASVIVTDVFDRDVFAAMPLVVRHQIHRAGLRLTALSPADPIVTVYDHIGTTAITRHALSIGSRQYDWISFVTDDTQVGVVYDVGTVDLRAEIADGEVMTCAPARPDVDVIPDSFACDRSYPSRLPETTLEAGDHSVHLDRYGLGDAVPELALEQMQHALIHHELLAYDADEEDLFGVADDGMISLSRVEYGGFAFDWASLLVDGLLVGAFFETDSLTMVAEVKRSGGLLYGCVPRT